LSKLYNRLRKYGWDNFDKIILMSDLSEEEAKNTEIEMIAKYNTFHQGLNSTPGGDGTGAREEHCRARSVRVFNNVTHDIMTFECIKTAAEYLNCVCDTIRSVLRGQLAQTYSPRLNTYVQIKYKEDDTPFVTNMPTPVEKNTGDANPNARAVRVHNNSTNEIVTFNCISDAAILLGIDATRLAHVSSSTNCGEQVYSPITKTWYQIKRIHDNTPFVKDMQTRYEKSAASNGKPVFVFGNVYPSAKEASNCLRPIFNMKKNFIVRWININKYDDIFYLPKDPCTVLIWNNVSESIANSDDCLFKLFTLTI